MPMDMQHQGMPMGGQGGGMPEAPPAAGAEASPDALAESTMQQQQAQIDAVVAATPAPEEAYDPKLLAQLADAMNIFVEAIAGEEAAGTMPRVEWAAPEGTKRLDAPLPRELWVPMFVISAAIAQAGFAEKHGYDPLTATKNAAVRGIAGKIERAAKDKKLVEALRGAPPEKAEEPAEEQAPIGPTETEDERAIMAGMK